MLYTLDKDFMELIKFTGKVESTITLTFYQPQGWSTCAAGPGAGSGPGDI